jgi:hypothetical protein
MHFSFNLLSIKTLHMFRALLAHSQEALHKRHLVYYSESAIVPQPTDITRMQYTKCRCATPPEDEQVMFETCRGSWFSMNWIKSASRWFHYTDVLRCTVSKTLSFTIRTYCVQIVVRLFYQIPSIFNLRNLAFDVPKPIVADKREPTNLPQPTDRFWRYDMPQHTQLQLFSDLGSRQP